MARGTEIITFEDLSLIETPEATPTYTPLGHYQLARSLKTISQDMLNGFDLIGERYEVAQNNQQLFAVLDFSAGDSRTNLSIGFRNSLNRTLAVGMCIGASVIVCSNLMFSAGQGGITVLKKHSANLMDSLESITINTLYKASFVFNQLIRDADRMRDVRITDSEAFKMLGLLFGHGYLSPRQLPIAHGQWLNPNHEEFRPRTIFSLYNAVTESLKSSPPKNMIENHINVHSMFDQVVDPNGDVYIEDKRPSGSFW